MSKPTTLTLLRHGTLKSSGLFCAPAQEPLNDVGLQSLFKATKGNNWDCIISSPYRRCLDFAETLADQNQTMLQINSQFAEMNFGDWEGISSKELWKTHADDLQQLWQNPEDFSAPQGESMQAFITRVISELALILQEHPQQSLLLITHAGVIRAILAHALNISHQSVLKFTIDYASLTQLHFYPDGEYSLQFHGKVRA